MAFRSYRVTHLEGLPMPFAANIYYFEHQGDNSYNPPIVLIHGAGGSQLHWPAPVRRLSGFPIYALDLPGHGKSVGRGYQSINAYVECVLEWMNAVELRQAVFIGHSMGGAIALSLALDHPERVLGLGIVGSGARLKIDPVLLESASRKETFPATIETIIEWAFDPQADPRLVELAAKRMAEIRPSVLHSDFMACDSFNKLDLLESLSVPTFILCGERDKLTPPRYSQYLADHISGAKITIISDAGHMVQLEKPVQVAETLREYISSISYQPGARGK
jgi:pimeloyl-ACP methyl ester carboxylesterase